LVVGALAFINFNMHKKTRLILILAFVTLFINLSSAQNTLRNFGNFKVFESASLGLHSNFINDGISDENKGLVGFYGFETLSISGALAPTFYDFELLVDNDLALQVPINIENSVNFVVGNITTPKNDGSINVRFLRDAFYVGQSNLTKVNGFVSASASQSFIFPVGDAQFVRPLILTSDQNVESMQCAYFFEDPNNPISVPDTYDTRSKVSDIRSISSVEFWSLQNPTLSSITLSWNINSDLGALAETVNQITIVGWNKTELRWTDLGTTSISGDLNQGVIISDRFIPDDYSAITFGSNSVAEEIIKLDDYLLTANGDGINDALVIPELERNPINSMQIFNRYGLKVFDQQNYSNEFTGHSNLNNAIFKDKGLPVGVYFYIVHLKTLGKSFQGFLYLSR